MKSDIVIAPHHGSNTSSTYKFAQAVSPEVVVYSTSFGNQWGFPRKEVSENWKKSNPKLIELNTGVHGQISFGFPIVDDDSIKENQFTVSKWSDTHCRYWHRDCLSNNSLKFE